MKGLCDTLRLMTQEADQSEFKAMVKQWLKSHNLNYNWVAEQCGVSEITVRNWMSQKNIPPLKQQLLEKVIVQMPTDMAHAAAEPVAGVKVSASLALTVQLTPEKYAQLAERAAAAGITMESLIAQAISQLLDNSPDTNNISTLRNRKVILPVNP